MRRSRQALRSPPPIRPRALSKGIKPWNRRFSRRPGRPARRCGSGRSCRACASYLFVGSKIGVAMRLDVVLEGGTSADLVTGFSSSRRFRRRPFRPFLRAQGLGFLASSSRNFFASSTGVVNGYAGYAVPRLVVPGPWNQTRKRRSTRGAVPGKPLSRCPSADGVHDGQVVGVVDRHGKRTAAIWPPAGISTFTPRFRSDRRA